MERRKSVHISKIIQEILKQNNMHKKLNEVTIEQSWASVVGETMAKYTSNVYINRGVLHVSVSSSVVRNELSMNRLILIEKLNAITQSETITDIIFR